MAKRKPRVRLDPAAVAGDPLKMIGELLKSARLRKGENQEDASRFIWDKASKANISNIEEGNVALPWRAIPKFAEYTGVSEAAIVVLLGAAKTWHALEKEPAARSRM